MYVWLACMGSVTTWTSLFTAMRILAPDFKGSPLPLDKMVTVNGGSDTIHNILREKHPVLPTSWRGCITTNTLNYWLFVKVTNTLNYVWKHHWASDPEHRTAYWWRSGSLWPRCSGIEKNLYILPWCIQGLVWCYCSCLLSALHHLCWPSRTESTDLLETHCPRQADRC